MSKARPPRDQLVVLIGGAMTLWKRAVRVVPRLQMASCRALAGMGLLAVSVAFLLERTGPDGGFNGFCVGLLFGLGVGIAVAAIAALAREHSRG